MRAGNLSVPRPETTWLLVQTASSQWPFLLSLSYWGRPCCSKPQRSGNGDTCDHSAIGAGPVLVGGNCIVLYCIVHLFAVISFTKLHIYIVLFKITLQKTGIQTEERFS